MKKIFLIVSLLVMFFVCQYNTEARFARESGSYIGNTNTNYNHSISIGISYYYLPPDSTEKLSEQPLFYCSNGGLLSFDYLSKDPYNGNKSNYSFLPLFGAQVIHSTTDLITSLRAPRNQSLILWFIGIAPVMLADSRWTLNTNSIDFIHSESFHPSIYLQSKLNWFTQRSNSFWRYQPEIGVNFLLIKKITKKNCGLDLSIGAVYPIDLLHGELKDNGVALSLSAKFTVFRF